MSLSSRLSLLMLGTCLLPFGAVAAPALRGSLDDDPAGMQASHEAQADGEVLAVDDGGDTASNMAGMATRNRARPAVVVTPPPSVPVANKTGAGVLVGVVDTGIALTHSEFTGRIATGGACFGTTTACAGASATGADNQGHGTHVAGIIGAAANGRGTTGVAPGSLLLPVKVLDANGAGTSTTVAQGISHAAQRGARVINMSLGGQTPASGLIAPLQAAGTSAVLVAAAGNSGNNLSPGYPASYATQTGILGSMIIVGSVNASNRISTFSQTPGNGGCTTSGGVTRCLRDFFLVAPGERINSTFLNNSYAQMSGTSMAAPHVSGVAALVIGAAPYLTNRQVVDILLRTATDLGARGTDAVYGRGLVNAKAALAPVGVQTVATAGLSTASYTGSGEVSGSAISGPLGAGLRNASVLRSVTFFDEYGRDYKTDLTKAVAPSVMSVEHIVTTPSFSSQFVSFEGDGYAARGFVADSSENGVMSLGFTTTNDETLSDVVITARLSDVASVRFGYNAAMEGLVNRLDLAADARFDGLFLSASALNSPFLSLTGGGDMGAASLRLGRDAVLTVGYSQLEPESDDALPTSVMASDTQLAMIRDDTDQTRSARSMLAAVSWELAPWAMIGINMGQTDEEDSMLGSSESGALALTSESTTRSVGVSTRVDLGGGYALSASWSLGETDASPMAGSIVQSYSAIESQSYGVAIARRGIFSDRDSLGLAVSRPLHITSGSASIRASSGVTDDRGIVYAQEIVSLASTTPETDYELGYTTLLSADTMLQASLIYQQNAGGEAGVDALAGVVTLTKRW
ncbi:MAG: S8 family serine peptidase [Alphaproteobacteria bacterium]